MVKTLQTVSVLIRSGLKLGNTNSVRPTSINWCPGSSLVMISDSLQTPSAAAGWSLSGFSLVLSSSVGLRSGDRLVHTENTFGWCLIIIVLLHDQMFCIHHVSYTVHLCQVYYTGETSHVRCEACSLQLLMKFSDVCVVHSGDSLSVLVIGLWLWRSPVCRWIMETLSRASSWTPGVTCRNEACRNPRCHVTSLYHGFLVLCCCLTLLTSAQLHFSASCVCFPCLTRKMSVKYPCWHDLISVMIKLDWRLKFPILLFPQSLSHPVLDSSGSGWHDRRTLIRCLVRVKILWSFKCHSYLNMIK